MDALVRQSEMTCNNCGQSLAEEIIICPFCGRRVVYDLTIENSISQVRKRLLDLGTRNALISKKYTKKTIRFSNQNSNDVFKSLVVEKYSLVCLPTDEEEKDTEYAQTEIDLGEDTEKSEDDISNGNINPTNTTNTQDEQRTRLQTELTSKDFSEDGFFFQMGVPPVRVDVLMGIPGVQFEDCWKRRTEMDFDGLKIDFISKEDLITAKQASGRPQDLIDADLLSQKMRTKRKKK